MLVTAMPAAQIDQPVKHANKHSAAKDVAKCYGDKVFEDEIRPGQHSRGMLGIGQPGSHSERHHVVTQDTDRNHEHVCYAVLKSASNEKAYRKQAGGHFINQ